MKHFQKMLCALLAVFAIAATATGCAFEGDLSLPIASVPTDNSTPADSTGGSDNTESTHIFTAFTPSDKQLFLTYVGEVIPFLPNDEYYVEGWDYENPYDYSNGLCFYTYGNTPAEFDAYRALYSDYTLVDTYIDNYGDTCYVYENAFIQVDMCCYYYEDETGSGYCVEVYACALEGENEPSVEPDEPSTPDEPDTPAESVILATFTLGANGSAIHDDGTEGSSKSFSASGYTLNITNATKTYFGARDAKGNSCIKVGTGKATGSFQFTVPSAVNSVEISIAKYKSNASAVKINNVQYALTKNSNDGQYETILVNTSSSKTVSLSTVSGSSRAMINTIVFLSGTGGSQSGGQGGSDDQGGSSGGSSGGSNGGSGSSNANLLQNDGKGLPTGTNGVYTVDFTKATYVKDVHDQGYYLGGCPTTGNVKVLVIPVEFSDVTASSKGYTISTIEKAFNGSTGTTDYYSVAEYYRLSSYGKLNLTFDVMDTWFKPANKSSYYLNAKIDYYGEQVEGGDQIIINEFLQKYNSTMDFSQYDSDNNGTIDAVVLINTLTINYDITMQWAYRYWNLYTDSRNEYYEYDGVYANDYLWASYAFLFEDENGDFTDKSACNTYTFIHEFGHVLGADDYYDTSYSGGTSPTNGHDIMDSELGDHNPYTKFNYGWITSSRLVTASDSVTLMLNAFDNSASGTDTIIIANNWDATLGAYQEYFVLIYYKNTGLNSDGGYFSEEGIVVYHINATLYVDTEYGETYYDVYNNNTDASDPDGYGTENDLVELVKNGRDYVFGVGDSLAANTKIDSGEKIAYTFTVTSLNSTTATITFTKNA